MRIGAIGGSDGPTAIFVSSSDYWVLVIGAAIVIAGIIAAILIWKKKR